MQCSVVRLYNHCVSKLKYRVLTYLHVNSVPFLSSFFLFSIFTFIFLLLAGVFQAKLQ